jgi:hypothetical protein
MSYSQLEKLLFVGRDASTIEKKNQNCLFLHSQVFRKTYVMIKKQMDDWLRKTHP